MTPRFGEPDNIDKTGALASLFRLPGRRFLFVRGLTETLCACTIPKTEKERIACEFSAKKDGCCCRGCWYGVDRAACLVDAINARQPDVVLFGGDLLDNYARDRDSLDLEELAAQLGRIQAPGGKFAVWGNHDYGGGAVRVYESLLEQAGFQVLNDESRLLEEWNVQVVGYDDVLMGWTDPELYQLNRDIFQLVVAHEPSVAEKISAPGECFVLSGHTHGGQASLPLLNRLWLPAGSGGMVRGDYTTQDGTQVYVSSGVGLTKLPLRFLCPPEIVCVTFEPAV